MKRARVWFVIVGVLVLASADCPDEPPHTLPPTIEPPPPVVTPLAVDPGTADIDIPTTWEPLSLNGPITNEGTIKKPGSVGWEDR